MGDYVPNFVFCAWKPYITFDSEINSIRLLSINTEIAETSSRYLSRRMLREMPARFINLINYGPYIMKRVGISLSIRLERCRLDVSAISVFMLNNRIELISLSKVI